MHYSRIMPPVKGHRYLPSTAILLNEIIKLSISLTMALYDLSGKHQNSSVTALFSSLVYSVLAPDAWKMAIPAMLYTLQNTLQYIAVSNLDAFIFQITYQLKIITTAMFSVSLLGRALSTRKWLSLLLLTVGVAVVQFPHGSMPMTMSELREDSRSNHWFKRSLERVKDAGAVAVVRLTRRSATYQGIAEDFALHNPTPNFSIGLLAIAVACITSGLAGVYFERVLKYNGSKQPKTSNQSVWVRNVQLSFFSIIPALLLGVMYKDGETIAHTGFFAGYNWIVWLAIALQAAGGILVALVISHANNIAKNFATSISVVISFLASVVFFDLEITFTVSATSHVRVDLLTTFSILLGLRSLLLQHGCIVVTRARACRRLLSQSMRSQGITPIQNTLISSLPRPLVVI